MEPDRADGLIGVAETDHEVVERLALDVWRRSNQASSVVNENGVSMARKRVTRSSLNQRVKVGTSDRSAARKKTRVPRISRYRVVRGPGSADWFMLASLDGQE